jgi:hypothetical protein
MPIMIDRRLIKYLPRTAARSVMRSAFRPFEDARMDYALNNGTLLAAPVASGWSGCRVGLAPTGKRRLFTAHARS